MENGESQIEHEHAAIEQELRIKRSVILGVDKIKKMEEINAKGKELLKKYPDARKYKLWHILIWSTPPAEATEFDLPGDDSIIKYIREFYDKVQSENKQV